jgi:hypothetical protein
MIDRGNARATGLCHLGNDLAERPKCAGYDNHFSVHDEVSRHIVSGSHYRQANLVCNAGQFSRLWHIRVHALGSFAVTAIARG